jgi:uncharacterized protein YraI
MMKLRLYLLLSSVVLLAVFSAAWLTPYPAPLRAQDLSISDPACAATINALWTLASEACIGKPQGYVCNGASAPNVLPDGPVRFALEPVGALVEAPAVDMLNTTALMPLSGVGGIAWLRIAPPIEINALLLGDVTVQDISPADFAPWQSWLVQTSNLLPSCPDVPQSAVIAQVLRDQQIVRVVINGVSIDLSGTLMIRTAPNVTTFTVLQGRASMIAFGQTQVLLNGQQLTVPYGETFNIPAGPPSVAAPLASVSVLHLPGGLLDRPIPVPQPGFVRTLGRVNMRSAPSTGAALLLEVPSETVLMVLGRNPAGDWYHVELSSGASGWIFAELLDRQVGTINAIYSETPQPPVRYGSPQIIAEINAPAGVNLRNAPDVSFDTVVTLPLGTQVNILARSPYSPWVKVEAGGVVGWVALIALNTNAYIESLPIDYQVPPPPPPTAIPGSFGNAFPDPARGG